jgi:hypothetical protein
MTEVRSTEIKMPTLSQKLWKVALCEVGQRSETTGSEFSKQCIPKSSHRRSPGKKMNEFELR